MRVLKFTLQDQTTQNITELVDIWYKVLKSGPNKICGRQPLKILKRYDLL